MNDIDHKAEVQRLTLVASEHDSVAAATVAVAEATLHLAEQQRIANLIAYATAHYPDARTATGDEIHSAIRDGLGIK